MKNKTLSFLMVSALLTSTLLFSATTVKAATISPTPVPLSQYGVTYKAHVQNIGWTKLVTNTEAQAIQNLIGAGTVGQGKRLEAIEISGTNLPSGASITAQAHVQNIGWQKAVVMVGNKPIMPVLKSNEVGSDGLALRVEAFKLTLNGMPGYAIEYQVQGQSYGWQSPVITNNGTSIVTTVKAGTTGKSLRLETIRIEIVKSSAEEILETTAINDAVKAESTKLQADVDTATTAIKSSIDTTLNTSLTARVAIVQKEITDNSTAYISFKS